MAAPNLFPLKSLPEKAISDRRFRRLLKAYENLSTFIVVKKFDGDLEKAKEVTERSMSQRRSKLGDYNSCHWCRAITDQYKACIACQRTMSGMENGPLSKKGENGQMSKFKSFENGLLACVDKHLENVRVAKAKKVRAATTIQKMVRGFSARNNYLLDAMDAAFASLCQVRADLRALGHLSSDDNAESHFEVAR